MLSEMLVVLAVGIVAAAVISVITRKILPIFGAWAKKSFDFVGARVPRTLLPLEQTLLCIGVVAATCYILAHPEAPPWGFLTSLNRTDELNTIALLGAAAALLASLCFAATFLRAAEKDASGGELYLGTRLSTFLISKSKATGLLGNPAFHLMTLILFLIPLVHGFLPDTWAPAPAEIFPVLAPKSASVAVWCSCFGFVGLVLILNILSVLRSSTVGLLQPSWLRFMVRTEMRRTAADGFERRIRQPQYSHRAEIREWAKMHLEVATAQPTDMFSTYYGLTISPGNFGGWNERSLARYERISRREVKTRSSRAWGEGSSRGIILRVVAQNRLAKMEGILTSIRDVRLGWLDAMIGQLGSPHLPDFTRSYIVDRVLQNVQVHERQLQRIRTAFTPTSMERHVDPIFKRQVGNLPSVTRRYVNIDDGPVVDSIPADVFQRLAGLLLPNTYAGPGSNASGVHLTDIFEAADSLQNNETRLFALTTLTTHLIDCTILRRGQEEQLDISMLESLIPKNPDYMRGSSLKPAIDRESRTAIMERCAFAAVIRNSSADPAATEVLLGSVHEWRLSAALLHRIFYRKRSRGTLKAADLAPFWKRFQSYKEVEVLHDSTLPSSVASFLSGSDVGHFVVPEGVVWLYKARKEPLGIELCEEFERRRLSGQFYDFGLVQFFQWWMTSRSNVWGAPRIQGRNCMGPRHNLADSSNGLREFAEAWVEVDSRNAFELGLLLNQIVPVVEPEEERS